MQWHHCGILNFHCINFKIQHEFTFKYQEESLTKNAKSLSVRFFFFRVRILHKRINEHKLDILKLQLCTANRVFWLEPFGVVPFFHFVYINWQWHWRRWCLGCQLYTILIYVHFCNFAQMKRFFGVFPTNARIVL